MSSAACKLKQQDLKWTKPRTLTTPNVDTRLWSNKPSFVAGGDAEWISHFGRQFWKFLTKLNNSSHKIQQLPDIYSSEFRTYVHTKACWQVFISASFRFVKIWKQRRCPSVGEWMINCCNKTISAKKKWAMEPQKDLEEMCVSKWKKPICKCYILYHSNYLTLRKRQK